MLTCVLWMWLASNPSVLYNVGQFDLRSQCIAAQRKEIAANMRIGKGGGVHYFCADLDRGVCDR